jgi:hypothetical protein
MVNLSAFLNDINERKSNRLDFVAPANTLNLDYDDAQGSYVLGAKIEDDQKQFNINHSSKRQVCDKLNIPAKYFDYLDKNGHHNLAMDNINYLFKHGDDKHTVRSVNGTVTAFLSDRFDIIDNNFIANAVAEAIVDDYSNEKLNVIDASETDKKLYMKITKPSVKAEIAKGDIVEAGVIISNSETGHGAINVNPFINRLICLNGMTINDARFKAVHLAGAKEEGVINHYLTDETKKKKMEWLHAQIGDVVNGSLKQSVFQQSVDKITDASKEIIKPTEAIEIITDKFQLSKDESKSIFDKLASRDAVDSGDPSRWSLINAVTNTARDLEDIDRKQELEAIGGKILAFVMPKQARVL